MSPYRAMFGIEPFMAWGPHEAKRITGEPYDLPNHLRDLHAALLSRGMREQDAAAKHYDRKVSGVSFKEGDRVLVWSPDLVSLEGNKLARPWLGPYAVRRMLFSTSYLLESEVGGRHARAHANRMRQISANSLETGDPREGVFPDSLRLIGKIRREGRGRDERGRVAKWLKVKLGAAAPWAGQKLKNSHLPWSRYGIGGRRNADVSRTQMSWTGTAALLSTPTRRGSQRMLHSRRRQADRIPKCQSSERRTGKGKNVRNARVSLAFRAAEGWKASGRGFAWTTFEGKCALSRLDRGS